MATRKTATPTTFVESKTIETITKKTILKETENHIFTASFADNEYPSSFHGNITHKDGTSCGSFVVTNGSPNILNVSINMDCKELFADILVMLDDIANNRIVEVDEFTYVKNTQTSTAIE